MNNKNHKLDQKENNNDSKKEIHELDEELLREAAELGAKFKVDESKNNNEENKQLKDQLLRLAADFENFKKRSAKDIEDTRNYSITNFAKDLLNIMDNFGRSIEALNQEDQDSPRVKAVIDGIIVVQKELENSFIRQNINAITPSIGDDFDHNFHQAIAQIPTDEVEEGKIYGLMQTGYSIKDRLLRPALVSIAVKSSS